jgi:hypothetical protein
MHPHIELTIANDQIAERIRIAERRRAGRAARPKRRHVRFAHRIPLARRLSIGSAR